MPYENEDIVINLEAISDEELEKLAALAKQLESGELKIEKEDAARSPIEEIVDAASEGAEDDDQEFSIQSEVVKAFPQRKIDRRGREYRMIKSMVMSPRKIDKQNDWTDEDEIQDAMHEFMIGIQMSDEETQKEVASGAISVETGLSYRHARMIKSNEARIVECSQLDFPETWGIKQYPAGTWKIGIRVYDEKIFGEIDSGKLRGCSIEGSAVHSPQPLQS